jgi:phosphoribosylanthranilate isomerase
MMVKICGITNCDDALAAVDAGASAIGFNFYRESPRYISPTGAALITEKIAAEVWKVGVFVNETPETIARIVLDARLDVAQLHGNSKMRGIRIWQALPALGPAAGPFTESVEA